MRNTSAIGGYQYTCVNGKQLVALAQRFRAEFSGAQVQHVRETREYWDTIDGCLFRAGLVCEWTRSATHSGTLQLRRLGSLALIATTPSKKSPVLINDVTLGPLRARLLPIMGLRALLPVVRCTVSGQCVSRYDRAGKLLARIYFEKITPIVSHAAVQPLYIVRLCPLRGYAKAAREMATTLSYYAQLQSTLQDVYNAVLAAAHIQPIILVKAAKIKLHAEMRADHAMGKLLHTLLATMQANEAGMLAQWDTEFLHVYRVALRRTRSAIEQTKKIFPAQSLTRFMGEFAWVGGVTGCLRDLDVYLLEMENYRQQLPAELRPGLVSLEKLLRFEQALAQRSLEKALGSARYRRLMTTWRNYLDTELTAGISVLPAASLPIKMLANKRIEKSFRRVIKQGSKLNKHSPDEQYHMLRDSCKQLRYLLELFRSLYPREVKQAVTMLKGLQDHLGRFQDVCVQAAALSGWRDQLINKTDLHEQTITALDKLMEILIAQRAAIHAQFKQQFAPFSSDQTSRFFRTHFRAASAKDADA